MDIQKSVLPPCDTPSPAVLETTPANLAQQEAPRGNVVHIVDKLPTGNMVKAMTERIPDHPKDPETKETPEEKVQ